jgi:flotillin
MDLTPITIDIDLRGALSQQNIRINVPAVFTVGISTEPETMSNAAERLLGIKHNAIQTLASDIILGQLRVVIATMQIEEINADRDKFLDNVANNVGNELTKIGLKLINVNVTDITDESGYIEALGKEAAAHAVNEAKKNVAIKDKDGAIGEANAQMEQRVNVAAADAKATEGENEAKVTIANSDSERRQKVADANGLAVSAENVAVAEAEQRSLDAERQKELARAEREKATQQADIIVPANIAKDKVVIEAQAEAEKLVAEAEGRGEAIFSERQGEAKGAYEILSKQAEGMRKIVESAGGDADKAAMLLVVEKLTDIVKLQVEAISNLHIDKVVVWDGMGGGHDGNPTTANFLKGMMGAVPPLSEVFKMAGMELPAYFGQALKEGNRPEMKHASTDTASVANLDENMEK